MWLSSYQLLIHYQSNTGKLGVHYNRSNRTWDDGEEFERLEGYDFTRFAAWLIAATKAFAKLLELPISIQPRLPWGTTFRCWQRCVYVPANPADFEGIDLFLRDRGITSVKKVSAFQQLGQVGRVSVDCPRCHGIVSPVRGLSAGRKTENGMMYLDVCDFLDFSQH